MLILGIVIALVLGVLARGDLANLGRVSFRGVGLLFLGVLLRYATEFAIRSEVELAETLRLPLYGLAFGLVAVALWMNREKPGLIVAAAGVTANGAAIVANGGWMPVWGPALQLAGMPQTDLVASFHRLLPESMNTDFLLHLGPLGDIVPVPIPLLENVASMGDVFLAIGLGWFVFGTLVGARSLASRAGAGRQPVPSRTTVHGLAADGASDASTFAPVRAETGLLSAGVPAQILAPTVVGTAGGGTAATGVTPFPAGLRRISYVRLALDARFSALWIGQLVSLLGDRVHQVALAVLVLGRTDSPAQVGLTLLAVTAPNLLFGPIAGTFVDRWDQKRTMVASDLIRAGLVLLLPLAVEQSFLFVYPIAFSITTVGVFFRPARSAVIPRIVPGDDLNAANGAMSTAETVADIAGYPFAGLFVGFLGSALAIAFWVDAVSYLVSAVLIGSMIIPPVARRVVDAGASRVGAFLAEMRDGWRFLRSEPALFGNTLISAAAQVSIGATITLTVVYARDVLDGTLIGYPQSLAALDAAIGVGNLIGGIAIGAVALKRGGRVIVAGYVACGLSVAALGLTHNVAAAIVCAAVAGVANMAFLIPTQTLFARRTPPELMGRVVGTRFSIVFGALTVSTAVSGFLAERIGVGEVFLVLGLMSTLVGLVGALVPAVRDA